MNSRQARAAASGGVPQENHATIAIPTTTGKYPGMKFSRFMSPLVMAALAFPAFSETVKDREGAVRSDRATLENDARWIYSDYQKGFVEAKRTGSALPARSS